MELIGDSANLAVFWDSARFFHWRSSGTIFSIKIIGGYIIFPYINEFWLFHLEISGLVGGFSTKNLHKNDLFCGPEKSSKNRLAFQIARRSLAAEAASSKFSLASWASTAVVGVMPGVEQNIRQAARFKFVQFVFFFLKGKGLPFEVDDCD